MKNLLNLKGLCRSSQLAVNPDSQPTVNRRSRLMSIICLFLLTLGAGQMWGGNAGYVGNNESYFKNYVEYSKNGGSATQFKVAGTGQSDLALGVVSSLTLTQYGVGMYQDADNLNGKGSDKFCYWIHEASNNTESWKEITGNWEDWSTYGWSGGWRHPGFGNNNLGINVLDGLGAGKYKLTFYFKHQGNSNWGNAWLYLSNDGKNYNITFTIAPVVTFKANGGSGSDKTQTVTYNTNTALSSNTFTRTGYTFAGWATSADGSVAYADGASVKLTAHTTLYAKWTANTYTITYKDQGNVAYTGSNEASLPGSYTYGVGASLVPGEKAGYSFGGWYTASDCSSGLTTSISNSATGDKTFYAKWTLEPGVSLSATSATLNIGQTVRLTATGSNASNITKYDFYEGSTKIGTVTTSATSATYDYTPTTTGSKTMKVTMTYNSGSSTVTSSTVGLTLNTPSVATLTEASSTTEMWIGIDASDALTFSATSNNVGSGASVTWSISDATSGTFTQTSAGSYSGKSWTYTPASTGAKTITVTMNVGGSNYTKTYSLKVYERWNIYVQNNCGWAGGIALYFYGNETPASWPGVQGTGTGCEQYSAKWWKVTLDSKYTKFILDNNVNGGSGEEKLVDNVAVDKVAYPANSYWDFSYSSGSGPKYYTLHSISPSVPTVSITSTEVISSTQIKLTGTISNYGSDGSSAASHLNEVGFYCGETKHSTTHTSGNTFTKVITGLSAGTEYTFKAYAVNVKGEGKQASGTNVTTRAGGTYTIKVRTAVGASTPKIYAWTDADANDGVKEENATSATGAAMTAAITGTVYKWWSYELNKTYNKFLIYQGTDGTKTNNITAPQAATCYWYNSANAQASRYGVMDCPHANPQLYIETTAGSGTYEYYEMTNTTGTLSKSLNLTAKSTYKFKIFYNGEYFGKDATASRASNTIEDLSAAVETYAKITTDAAGDYTFSYTTEGKDLTVIYPTAYTITYGIGAINGSNTAIGATSSPSFTSGDYVLKTTAVTFTKGTTKNGYHWEGWYPNSDGSGDAWSTTDGNWTSAANTRIANIKVYACYSLNTYTITYHLDGGSNHKDNPANFNVTTATITLQDPTKTGYTFAGWYTNADKTVSGKTIPLGTYTNKEFWAKWTANTYTITLNQNGATTESTPTSLTATYDGRAGGASDQFTLTNPEKTGYTFAGWYENEGGSGAEIITTAQYYKWEDNPYVDATGHWQHDGNVTVYAKWTPNNYAVTLSTTSETGYGSNAPANQTATYGADMPAITPPTPLPGYKFQGYFTEANGGGIQYYNADGTSAKTWDIASATTLHAYFQKAEITALTHDAVVAKATTAYLTVNPTIVPASGIQGALGICWTLLYDNGSEVAGGKWSVAPSVEDYQVRYTLNNLENGTYQVKAVLKASANSFDPCSAGSELMNITASFRVIGENTVTIRYVDADGNTLRSSGSVTIEPSGNADVVAPAITGYTFASWQVGDGVTQNSADGGSINISATYDGILTAKYNKKKMVYFNNTIGWDTVFVYFYNSAEGQQYWDNGVGAGACKNQGWGSNSYKKPFWQKYYGGMKRVAPGSNIWYFDYLAAGFNESDISSNIAFAKEDQACDDCADDNTRFFHNTEAIFRGDFSPANTPMYVPLTEPTTMRNSNSTKYYDQGYWMNYPDNAGYTLKIYDNTTDGALKKTLAFPFAADKKMPMSITTDLEGAKTYGFTVERADGTVYGNNGTMTNGHSGDEGQAVWEFKTEKSRAGLTTSSAGDYTFTLTYGADLSSKYNYLVGVHYPEATGDFRVQYSDSYNSTWKTSVVIPAGTERDTVSYFVRKDRTPYIRVQKCTATYEGGTTTVTWNNESSGSNIISSLPATVAKDGVYNFIFTKSNGALVLSKVEPYTGNFYIRVDGAGTTDWDNYRAADHLMAYSDYSFHQSVYPYSHYFTKWYDCSGGVKNIKFVVANDYSTNVSDTLTRETATGTWENIADYIDKFGNLSRSANVRFMYNSETNEAGRVFIDGAYADGGNFLKILADASDNIYLVEEGGEAQTEITFTDKGNWVYEQTVYAEPGAEYKLRSIFGTTDGGKNEITQWFKGDEDSKETLIGGSSDSRLKIRLIYDFKTNRLVTAYVPSNTLSAPIAINADVMFVRDGQDEVAQITFTDDGALNEINTVYSTLRFNKWTLNNRSTADGHALLSTPLSRYERDLYWISFPYDVKVSNIIGFGTYGKHWIIEYYDGAKRARNGYWADTRGFWDFVTPAMKDTFTLKAGTGYLVALDLDELWWTSNEDHSDVWDNTSEVELLFPGNVNSISNSSVTVTIPSHECLINRGTPDGNRTIKDSHWNVIGVPTYLNTTGVSFSDAGATWMTDGKPNYIYTWNMQDNTLSPVSAADFNYQSMYAYMVQYFGEITFTTSVSPAAAPHRNPDLRKDVEFRLELQQNNEATDHTFVRMSNGEDVTNGFAFGEDMSKEFCQSKANIYTLIGTEPVAGNVLPMNEQTTIVPVGVKIATEGEYTFTMPEGTESIGVVLKDNETGARTNLALFDYTVTLSKGAVNDRFVLEISPIANVPTALGNVQSDNVQGTKARKTIVDGIMYILRDGKIYDARGNKVK